MLLVQIITPGFRLDNSSRPAGLTCPLTGRTLLPRRVQMQLRDAKRRAECQIMMNFTELAPVPADRPAPFTDQLRLAVAAYLSRFKRSSREHTESDIRCFLAWCAERGLDPLAAVCYRRVDLSHR